MANRIILKNFIDPSKRLAAYRILGGFLDEPVVEGHLSPILLEVFFVLSKTCPQKNHGGGAFAGVLLWLMTSEYLNIIYIYICTHDILSL